MNPPIRRRELATFLRSRRQQVDPTAHGLDPARRRDPGLRREEVATIAGVSMSWYTWLEQARDIRASAEVLMSISRALLLDTAEREYVLRLGGHSPPTKRPADAPDPRTDPQLRALVEGLLPNPASILTPSLDYVSWNSASERLVPGFLGCAGHGTYNLARLHFCGEPNRESVEPGTNSLVGWLRANAARHPRDPSIRALVSELSERSAAFDRLWQLQEVGPTPGALPEVRKDHPEVGQLVFQPIHLTPDHFPELTLVVLLPSDAVTARGIEQFLG